MVAATAALTCAAAVLGALVAWPSPERTTSGWQVADVPASTAGLVLGTAGVCLLHSSPRLGPVLSRRPAPGPGHRPRRAGSAPAGAG